MVTGAKTPSAKRGRSPWERERSQNEDSVDVDVAVLFSSPVPCCVLTYCNQSFLLTTYAKETEYIPLSNRVRGPYRKLRTEFFSPRFYGPSAKRAGHKSKGKKRGSVTYSTDRENEVSKIFIISLLCV